MRNSRPFGLIGVTVGYRTLLAKTCKGCGELLPARSFRSGTYKEGQCTRSPECHACTTARYDLTNKAKRRNEESRDHAENHWQHWGQEEDELVLSGKPIAEIAAATGRTYAAVRQRRYTLRNLA